MNSKSMGNSSILIIFVVLVLITGAYYLGTKKVNSPETEMKSAQPITSLMPAQEPSQTSTWKTYTNTATGYSLDYPADWTVSEQNNDSSANQIVYFNYDGDYNGKEVVKVYFTNNVNIQKVKESGGGGDAGMGYEDANKKIETIEGREVIKIHRKHTALDFQTQEWVDTGESYIIYITLRTGYLILTGDIQNKQSMEEMVNTFRLL